jgi:hypothetical protein
MTWRRIGILLAAADIAATVIDLVKKKRRAG